ncbi:hypothetical protein CDB79_RS15285 [Vibrio parahaemolyticus]|uniref:hypothetical protein n=1 Tax=Vibrio parahaemolyticus TaxID=670 RepID=UPI000418B549|nr:hypothetical protein [Vibrio parahaemolyticus]EJG1710176.1 hypothetical protein [Vibrio parahaemolyticus]EJG1743338.1 hypothetical protein [Vibrio parahaemolyticus]EJG1781327.1 hypothetical protein [Vibrio parahaemolyticus]MDZ5179174.1 hypothetical protein [Vibrio parahaemolyticus]SUP28808.1 Uncharacterised protein [Vibrio parahaemolyticus]
MPYYNGKWHRYSESERREYGRQQREQRSEECRAKWHAKWISKTGLKQERNWTDAMIKSLLEGKEQDAGKIKAYKRTLITRVEKTKKFQLMMAARVAKQQKKQKV